MTRFRYQAVSPTGDVVAGEMEAESQAAVIERLQGQGHVPIRADAATSWSLSRLMSLELTPRRKRVLRFLPLVTQQLATLLHAGLALDRVLELAQTVAPRALERESLANVLEKVKGGSSLADAMAAQGGAFPKFYVGMIRAGEAGGSLDPTLRQLAEFLERSQAARKKVMDALIYPIIVLLVGLGSLGIIFGFVVPRFRPLFEDAGTKLPFAARSVLWVSDLLSNYWWAILGGGIAIVLLAMQQFRRPATRRVWDRRLLRLPLIGDLITRTQVSRFARTLGTLLKNGVAPLGALAVTQETLSNTAIADALSGVADSLKQGKGLAEPLSRGKVVPVLAVQLIRVGEETARLDEMLVKIAEIFDEEVARGIERLLALLVPGVTVVLGVIVALVMGSILTAMLSIYELAV